MVSRHVLFFIAALGILPFASAFSSSGISSTKEVLRPLPIDIFDSTRSKRSTANNTQLDLQNDENFLWGNPRDDSFEFMFANMTMHTADVEMILNMQRFKNLISDAQCGNITTLTFNSNASFQYAMQAWDWVNGNQTYKLILVVDWPTCGPEDQLQPLYVNSVQFDQANCVAYLYGQEQSWKDISKTFDVEYGTAHPNNAPSSSDGLSKRFGPTLSYSKSLTLNLTSDLSGSIYKSGSFLQNEFSVDVNCTDCGSRGALVLTGKISVDLTSVKEISLQVTPQDVEAMLNLALHAQGSSNISITYAPTLIAIPVPGLGWSIPDVFDIGLTVKVKAGFGMSRFQGAATISYGISAAISNNATFEVDLANQQNNAYSGWEPQISQQPFQFHGNASANANVFTQIGLGLGVTVLGQGFEAALQFKAPDFIFTLGIQENTAGGVCGQNGTDAGVDINGAMGASLTFKAGTSGDFSLSEPVKRDAYPALDGVAVARGAMEEIEGAETLGRRDSKRDTGVSLSDTLWSGSIPLFSNKCFPISKRRERGLGRRVAL